MGRFNVDPMRHMDGDHFRVLTSVEIGLRNHEVVSLPLISVTSNIHRGGTAHILRDLAKMHLISYERGKKYDGYRLTNLGYDYLALRALSLRGAVGSVGNQIGVGKESDVYVGGDPNLKDLVLKFHRLGRTSFRKLKEKRDYHGKRHFCSWLYLSRIAALKEFTFLKALYARKFPVPEPIDCCRHTVVMGLIDGILLANVSDLDDPAAVYSNLMALITRFARYGLIHSDFNEFNLMLKMNGEIIVIDFPQIVSIDHPNAKYYFDRDVECIRQFFRRRFEFECEEYPIFDEMERKHVMDVELEASGFTRKMSLDLLKAYDNGEFNAHEDDSDESEVENEGEDDAEKNEREEEEIENHISKSELNRNAAFNQWIESAQKQVEDLSGRMPEIVEMDEDRQKKYQSMENAPIIILDAITETENKLREIKLENNGKNTEEEDNEDEVEDDTHSVIPSRGKVTAARSVYSSGSTIAPDEIKKRLMKEKAHLKKEKVRIKGKQLAVRRGRKTNMDVIKEHQGWEEF